MHGVHESSMNAMRSSIFIVGGALVGAVGAGLVASTGNVLLVLIILGALVGLGLATSAPFMLWLTIVVGLLLSGVAQLYFPEIQLIRWAIVPISVILGLHGLTHYIFRESDGRGIPPIIWWTIGFLFVAVAATTANASDFDSALVGLKGYFQVYGLLFGLALFAWSDRTIKAIPKVLFLCALIQLPFVAHQYLVLVPARVGLGDGIVPVDIVSGTFGAIADGGGANSALSAFLIATIACLTALWQRKVVSGVWLIVLSAVLLLPVALNESKISVVFLFVAFLVLFAKDVVVKPARFLVAVAAGMLMLSVLAIGYVAHAPAGVNSWKDLVRYTYKANFQSSKDFSGELSRAGAVKFWMNRHGSRDVFGTLLGHGVGSSRVASSVTVGDAQEKIDPSLKVGRISFVALLWDVGVIGLICVLGMYATAFFTAGRLSKHFRHDPFMSGLFHGLQAAVAVFFISFINKRFFVFHVGFQTLLMLVFGYLAYWSNRLPVADDKVTAPRTNLSPQ